MTKDAALKKALDYFGIQADEEGDLELLYYVVDESNCGDDISLVGYANTLTLTGMFDESIKDFRDSMLDALAKRHERDIEIFRKLFSIREEWAQMALWNSIKNVQDHYANCKREEFTDEQWDYLKEHKSVEETEYERYWKLDFAYEEGDPLTFESINQVDFSIDELGRMARHYAVSCSVKSSTMSKRIYKQWVLGQPCILTLYGDTYHVLIKDNQDDEIIALLNLSYRIDFNTLLIEVIPEIDIDPVFAAYIFVMLISKLKKGKIYYMQDDPKWNYRLKRRRIRSDIVRAMTGFDDLLIQEGLEIAGFENLGRISKSVLDIGNGEMKEGFYYEIVLDK